MDKATVIYTVLFFLLTFKQIPPKTPGSMDALNFPGSWPLAWCQFHGVKCGLGWRDWILAT